MYSQPYKRYVTGLLLVVYIFNQVDRGIFGILMQPIKEALSLTDSQLGFLAGPALILFYATLGVPIARLADRSSRVNIMAIAVALWSAVVMLSSIVGKFSHLALTRVGVGVGEAGFSAIAQSLITDYHTPAERPRAMSIFMLGIPLGIVTSYTMGGWVNQAFGWRAAFIVAGLPGLLLAILVKWTIKEPPRVHLPTEIADGNAQPPLTAIFALVWRQRTLRQLAIGQALANLVAAVFLTWTPTFFIRSHGMATGELGTWLGLVIGIGGSMGIWLGGYLTSRLGPQNDRGKLRLIAFVIALAAPLAVLALWCPVKELALCVFVPLFVLLHFFFAPTFSLVQGLSAAGIRATMASVFILIQILVSGIIGIQLLGFLSDALTSLLGDNAAALRWSMTVSCLLPLWAALHFWLAGQNLREEERANV
jgi:predicted MFS family arabinose efflux permease